MLLYQWQEYVPIANPELCTDLAFMELGSWSAVVFIKYKESHRRLYGGGSFDYHTILFIISVFTIRFTVTLNTIYFFSDSKMWIKSDWSVEIHQVFTLGITQLMEDIRDSVLRHGGYLDQLDINYDNLLDKFEKIIMELYTPQKR
jgi:hypothetical protein